MGFTSRCNVDETIKTRFQRKPNKWEDKWEDKWIGWIIRPAIVGFPSQVCELSIAIPNNFLSNPQKKMPQFLP
jgi:hypothetical protein